MEPFAAGRASREIAARSPKRFYRRAFTRKFTGLLLPEGVLTVIPWIPGTAPEAILRVAVITVALAIFTSLTSIPRPLTASVVSVVKFAPVNLICTVDPARPLAGLSH